jgi:hypothetical protein
MNALGASMLVIVLTQMILLALVAPAIVFLFLTSYSIWNEKTGGFKNINKPLPNFELYAPWKNDAGEVEMKPLAEVQRLDRERKRKENAKLEEELDRYVDGMPFFVSKHDAN